MQEFAVTQLSVASVFAYFKYNKDCCFSFWISCTTNVGMDVDLRLNMPFGYRQLK